MARKPYISTRYWSKVDGLNALIVARDYGEVKKNTPIMLAFLIELNGKYKKGEQYGFALTREQLLALIRKCVCLLSLEECLAEADKDAGLDAECHQAFKDCLHNQEAFIHHAKQVLGVRADVVR